jgi:drug/metabolite transporter (DMT)-like permease
MGENARMPMTDKSMPDKSRAYLQIHFCVLLWGFTAILGKLITLPALPLVWWRMLIVVAASLLIPRVWRGLRAMSWRLRGAYAGIGVLVALHWLTFYGAIKLSNASVAATCMALGTVFVAMVEPWLARTRFSMRDLALGRAVLPGVAGVVGGVPAGMRAGIAVGAVSALFVAIFGSLNKRLVEHGDPLAVTALELGAGMLALGVLAPAMPLLPGMAHAFAGDLFVLPSTHDAVLLLFLSLACTLLPFALSLVALRHMSAFAQQLAVNLEPVYAIVLAILLLGEQRELTPWFYAGVLIILAAVFIHPLLGRPHALSQPEVLGTAETKACAD